MAASGSAGNFQSIPALKPGQVPIPTTAGSVNIYMNLDDNLNIWTVDTFKVHRPIAGSTAYANLFYTKPQDYNTFPSVLPFIDNVNPPITPDLPGINNNKDITLSGFNSIVFAKTGLYKVDWFVVGYGLGEGDPQRFVLSVNGTDLPETQTETPFPGGEDPLITTAGHSIISINAGDTLQLKNLFPLHVGTGNSSASIGMTINQVG